MYQPRAKLEFIRRYCAPPRFSVCVDIDAAEEGRAGYWPPGKVQLRADMQSDAEAVKAQFLKMKVALKYRVWRTQQAFEGLFDHDHWRGPDIIACNQGRKQCFIVEVEADSSGQPEQKAYKAAGQILKAVSLPEDKWIKKFVIAVSGAAIAAHLAKMKALQELGITAVSLGETKGKDKIIFGSLIF